MSKNNKIIQSIVLSLFCIHFVLIISYNFFPNNYWLKRYVNPLFDQNWQFFAPDPPMESKVLFFKYKTDRSNGWSEWISPSLIAHHEFDYNRFSYNGKLLHLYAAINYQLRWEIWNITKSKQYQQLNIFEKENYLQSEIDKLKFKRTLNHFLKNWTNWKYKVSPDHFYCILIIEDNVSGDKKNIRFELNE